MLNIFLKKGLCNFDNLFRIFHLKNLNILNSINYNNRKRFYQFLLNIFWYLLTSTLIISWMNFDGVPMEDRYKLLQENMVHSIDSKRLHSKTAIKEYSLKDQFRKYYSSSNSQIFNKSFKNFR